MNKNIHDAILEATVDELQQQGPNFHMDDLARRLRISKRTLYEHFPSKQEMIKEALISLMNQVYDRHLGLLHNENMTAEEKLMAFFSINASGKVFSMRRARDVFTKMPDVCNDFQDYSARDWEILDKIFAEAQASEEFTDFDKSLLVHMLHSSADGILDYIDWTDHDYSFPEYMEKCIRMILYGIKKDRGHVSHDTEA